MTDAVLDAVAAALTAQGLTAVREFPAAALDRASGPVVCVGLRSNTLLSAGCGDYMGEQTDGNGAVSEVYGMRMESVLALDVYSPDDGANGAAGCVNAFALIAAALPTLPSGLRVKELKCGETDLDGETGMFLCRVSLACRAFLTRSENADAGEFTDFVLRGAIS